MARAKTASVFIALMTGIAGTAAAAPSTSECEARVNDSTVKLVECMQVRALWRHLADFQTIADRNPDSEGHGNRDTGTPGYLASVNYVAGLMTAAGYRVTIQSYDWKHFDVIGTPTFSVNGQSYVFEKDWFVARLSGSGSLNAPPEPTGSAGTGPDSESGCSARDFSDFLRGHIALLERGTCDFDVQVANAQSAGAEAVILYNDQGALGESGGKLRNDGGTYPALLRNASSIPVIGVVSHAMGADLASRYRAGKAPQVRLDIHTRLASDIDYNLIADSPFGDPDHVVVVDAHLDSIYGAGILDNASGSTTILQLALNMAKTPTHNQLRYIWFGGEELGLLGSHYYTRTLSKADLHRIVFDVDVDVTATPNYAVLIADPGHAHNASRFPPNVVRDSKIGNRDFRDYFSSVGIPSREARFGNDGTDSNALSLVGVPNTGILTQQDCCKREWEVDLWGGYRGNFEGQIPGHNGGCVDWPRRWCDNLSNNNSYVLEFASKAVAAVVLTLANDTSLRRRAVQ